MSEVHLEIPGDIGIVARLHESCIEAIRYTLSQYGEYQSPYHKSMVGLKRVLQILVVWGIDHMVPDGTLDSSLQTSRALQKATLVPLRAIGNIIAFDVLPSLPKEYKPSINQSHDGLVILLDESNTIIAQDEESENEFDTDDGDYPSSLSDSNNSVEAFQSCVSRMMTFTRCLADLSVALDCPSKDPEYTHEQETAEAPATLAPHQPYSQKILERFPSAPLLLVDRLGKSNLKRHQRIIERHLETEPMLGDEDNTLPEPSYPDQSVTDYQDRMGGAWNWVMDTALRDSALGSSIPTYTIGSQPGKSDISSILTSLAEASWRAFPPLTEDAKHGKPFECEGCGRVVVMTKTKSWRKHLMDDLHPYDCVFTPCAYEGSSFPDQKSWKEHVLLEHGHDAILGSESCILCNSKVPGGIESQLKHISRHLEEISAAALPRNVGSQEGSDTNSCNASSELDSTRSQDDGLGGDVGRSQSTKKDDDPVSEPWVIGIEEAKAFYG
ncbi:hypothetical protein PG996_016009 [Apiospora saccharicola]|uniref:Oxidoreductase acuF-like C2H2 type zinc-finger domain-containing protein n=1 Tax=Apiospora saccharicola TaxID=335842 RepID=A0ABR1TPY1_9PEZI